MIKSFFLFMGALLTAFVVFGIAVSIYIFWLPDIQPLATTNPQSTSLMRLREKQAKEKGQSVKSDLQWVPLSEISPYLVHAVFLAEDDQFYKHHGFDLEQIHRAIEINWEKRRFAYGGSTITQQLARTLFLSPRKSILRKAKEALITRKLESTLPKKRILEIYLNVVEWGRDIYGVEAAARHYFGKGANALTPEEAVSLASILPSPRRWNPKSDRGFMNRRKTILMSRMAVAGYLPASASLGPTEIVDIEKLWKEKTTPDEGAVPNDEESDREDHLIQLAPAQPFESSEPATTAAPQEDATPEPVNTP